MKENRDLYYIAALIDGEIKDPSDAKKLRDEIENDPELKFEYFIQSSIKNLVSERLKILPAPIKVRKRLERKISPERRADLISRLFPEIYFTKPMIAWGSTIILFVAIILIIFNRPPNPEYKYFAGEQKGSTNMYIQAKQNFAKILAGKLKPQLMSANSDKIKEFFAKQGVLYPTYVPEIKDWNLVGAVVSVDHGEKFAHHVYSTADGKLVYLFQVDETEIKKHEFLTLTDDLITYLNSGKCYEYTEGNLVTLLTRVKGNIFAVVSNCSSSEVENNFCQLN
jgi:hypothetical protein